MGAVKAIDSHAFSLAVFSVGRQRADMKLSPFAFGTLLTGLGVLILSPDAALIIYIGLDAFDLAIWRGLALFLVMLFP